MKLLILVFLVSCTKKSGPEETLRSFINYRFEKNQKRRKLLDMTDGELRSEMEKLSDEALARFLDTKNYYKRKLVVNVKNCETESKCFITYTLVYGQRNDLKNKLRDLEIKKVAEVVFTDNAWKIKDIDTLKTYIDNHEAVGISADGDSE